MVDGFPICVRGEPCFPLIRAPAQGERFGEWDARTNAANPGRA
jgi:hypothetical protein